MIEKKKKRRTNNSSNGTKFSLTDCFFVSADIRTNFPEVTMIYVIDLPVRDKTHLNNL